MQVGQDGQHPAVVGFARGEPELAEGTLDVLLYGSPGDEERLGYGLVGTALGLDSKRLAARPASGFSKPSPARQLWTLVTS